MFDRVSPYGDDPTVVSVEMEVAEPLEMDGGMVIFGDGSAGYLEEETPVAQPESFDANLALTLEESRLVEIGSQLTSEIQQDKDSRNDWESALTKGLNLLGIKSEDMTTPWPGACGLFSTLIPEAVVRFQSNAIMEIFPPSGPAKTNIIGRVDEEKEQQAQRVQDEFNYQLTEKIDDYREETEKLLFGLALSGAAFRKLYPDPITGRPCARYIPAEKFIVPYGATSLKQAARATEIFTISKNELKKLQASGFYKDTNVSNSIPEFSELQNKKDEINREDPPPYDDETVELYECHCDLDIDDPDGIARPYIVTLDTSGKVLSIYRNWAENDPYKEKIPWFVAYSYVPGLGFYGYGLLHLIGASAKTATIILRQLIDAGTLNNLPGGLKAKGLRMKGDSSPIRPGEWREAEVSGMKLTESFMPLPYKEPSSVLLALLQNVVEEGRKLGSIADVEIGDVSANAPVGTTLSIMDRAMKVMSAVQARLHNSMRLEFRILGRLIRDSLREEYEYEIDGPREIRRADFDDRIDIIPVSDPNAATLPQRVTQYQAAIQMSSTAPQIYNLPLLHRKMIEILGIRDADKIIPDPEKVKPCDPVQENMALITMRPVKAFEWQDHAAHIATHQAFFEDPKTRATVGQNPNANMIAGAIQAHIAEHFAFQYREQIERELGSPLPPLGETLPGDVESNLSIAVAEAARRLLGKDQAEAAAAEAQAKMQDPVLQMQMQEQQTKAAAVQQKQAQAQLEANVELVKAKEREATERERIKSQERLAAEAAIDRNEQFLAELKIEHEKMRSENQRTQAQILEILARVEQMGRVSNEPQA